MEYENHVYEFKYIYQNPRVIDDNKYLQCMERVVSDYNGNKPYRLNRTLFLADSANLATANLDFYDF